MLVSRMIIENMYQAKANLSRLIERALSGEEVVLAKAGKPLVRLVPFEEAAAPLKTGLLSGKVHIAKDFDAVSPEIDEMFSQYMPQSTSPLLRCTPKDVDSRRSNGDECGRSRSVPSAPLVRNGGTRNG